MLAISGTNEGDAHPMFSPALFVAGTVVTAVSAKLALGYRDWSPGEWAVALGAVSAVGGGLITAIVTGAIQIIRVVREQGEKTRREVAENTKITEKAADTLERRTNGELDDKIKAGIAAAVRQALAAAPEQIQGAVKEAVKVEVKEAIKHEMRNVANGKYLVTQAQMHEALTGPASPATQAATIQDTNTRVQHIEQVVDPSAPRPAANPGPTPGA